MKKSIDLNLVRARHVEAVEQSKKEKLHKEQKHAAEKKNRPDLYLMSKMLSRQKNLLKYKNAFIFIKTNPPALFHIDTIGNPKEIKIDSTALHEIKGIENLNELKPLKEQVTDEILNKFWEIIPSGKAHKKKKPQEEHILEEEKKLVLARHEIGEFVELLKKNQSAIALDARNTSLSREWTRQLVEAIKIHPKLCIVELADDALNPYLTVEERDQLQLLLANRRKSLVESQPLPRLFESDITTPTLGLRQYQHAKEKWLKTFEDHPTLRKEVEQASQQNINDILLVNAAFNPIQFDLTIIKNLSTSIKKEDQPLFNTHAQRVLQDYSAHMHVVQKLVGANFHSLPFIPIANQLNKAAEIIGSGQNISDQVSTVLETLKKLGAEKIEPQSIIAVTENLFKQVDNISGKFSEINQLKDQLFILENNLSTDRLKIFEVKSQLQEQQKALEKFTSQGINFYTLNQGFDAVGSVLSIVGVGPQLVNQVVTVGKAAVTIVDNIGKIVAGAAVLGPIGIIGGAIAAIFSVFNSGPSNEEKMLSQISEQVTRVAEHIDKRFDHLQTIICEGISKLAQHVDHRFDHLEKILIVMHEHQDKRFDILEGMLDQIYLESMKQFSTLGKQLKEMSQQIGKATYNIETKLDVLNKATQAIRKNIEQLDNKIELYARDDKEQKYNDLKRAAFKDFSTIPTPKDATKYASDFTAWAISKSKSSALADTQNDKLSNTDICNQIEQHGGIAFKINLVSTCIINLNKKLQEKDKIKVISKVANPQVWIDAARNYMRFIWVSMVLNNKIVNGEEFILPDKFISDQKDNTQEITRVGLELKEFIYAIKTNGALFHQLCEDYRHKMQFILSKTAQGLENLPRDLQHSMEEFATAYKLLYIFTALAFQQEYTREPILRSYLHTQLWDEKQLLYCLQYVKEQDSFIIDTIEKNLSRVIDAFEDLILEKIAQARHNSLTGYPLLDDTLQELEIFEQVCSAFHLQLRAILQETKMEKTEARTPSWKKGIDEAGDYYARGKAAVYKKDSTNAIAFFLQAKDKYKEVRDTQGIDPSAKAKVEKRLDKLKNPEGKYSSVKLTK